MLLRFRERCPLLALLRLLLAVVRVLPAARGLCALLRERAALPPERAALLREREALPPPLARLAVARFSPPRGRALKDLVELCRAWPVRALVFVAINRLVCVSEVAQLAMAREAFRLACAIARLVSRLSVFSSSARLDFNKSRACLWFSSLAQVHSVP